MTYPKLTDVKAMDDYVLLLSFGEEKRAYDFKPNLSHKYYQALRNPLLFQKVHVSDGELEWMSGQDFCPHTLYEQSDLV